MKRKSLLALLTASIGFAALGAFTACGDNDGGNGEQVDGTEGLEYELTNDERSYVVSLPDEGNWENADIVIPASYRSKPVTEIEGHGFEDSKIKSVTIPDSVKKIGTQAFDDCENLKTVTFGNGVTEIGDFAFSNTGIETLTVPASVTTIGNQVFQKNSALTTATVYGNAVCGDLLFDDCPVLAKAEFLGEESLSLGAQTFSDSPLLKELTIAADTVTFEYNTFADCKPKTFAATFETIYKADFASTIHAETPQELIFLRTETFQNKMPVSNYYSTVTSVTLPVTLNKCERDAFYSFNKLEKVAYEGTIGDWCAIEFEDGDSNPLSKKAELIIGSNPVEGKLTIPAGVSKINDYAFYRYKKITELEVSAGVTEIGDYAFYATSARTAKLPGRLTTIGLNAFASGSLYSINLPEGLTTIGEQAFEWCRLVLVTLPQSLETLGKNAFRNNRVLTRIVNKSSLTEAQIEEGAYIDSLSRYFELLTEADACEIEKNGDFIFWKDENETYSLMGYTGSAKEITLPAAVNGSKYAIHPYAFENTSLDKITFEDTANWHYQLGNSAASAIDVTDSARNATNLQDIYCRCEWYQIND